MAFDASRLIPSVDDSHVVSSKKLKVVNFSGNLGCDFQSNTTEDAFLKVSESFERRDFDSQTSDITGRRFEGCSKDLNHGCFDSEDNIHFKDDLLSFPKEEVEFSKGFRGEGNDSGSFEVVFGSKNRVFEDLGRLDFGSEVEFSSMKAESSSLEIDAPFHVSL